MKNNLLIFLLCCVLVLLLPAFFSGDVVVKITNGQSLECSNDHWYIYFLLSLSTSIFFSIFCTLIVFTGSILITILLRVYGETLLSMAESIFAGMRALPSIAWIPVLGSLKVYADVYGLVAMVSLGICPIMMTQILHGVNSCPPEKIIAANLSGSRKWRNQLYIILPNSKSELLLSIRYGLSLSFILVLVYELFFNVPKGIMHNVPFIDVGYTLGDSMICLLILALAGIMLDRMPIVLSWLIDIGLIAINKRQVQKLQKNKQ